MNQLALFLLKILHMCVTEFQEFRPKVTFWTCLPLPLRHKVSSKRLVLLDMISYHRTLAVSLLLALSNSDGTAVIAFAGPAAAFPSAVKAAPPRGEVSATDAAETGLGGGSGGGSTIVVEREEDRDTISDVRDGDVATGRRAPPQPGRDENERFGPSLVDPHSGIAFWRDFQRDRPWTAVENARDVVAVGSRFASLGPEGVSFWAVSVIPSPYTPLTDR